MTRQLIALVIVAIMLSFATTASGQVWCSPCPPVYYLPIVRNSEVAR